MTNHIALNLVTKGLLNISNVTKGMLLYYGVVPIHKKKGGGGVAPGILSRYYEDERDLYDDIKKHEDIDVIKVYVDWDKKINKNKKITAKLLKKHIEAEILKETGKGVKVIIEKKTPSVKSMKSITGEKILQ